MYSYSKVVYSSYYSFFLFFIFLALTANLIVDKV